MKFICRTIVFAVIILWSSTMVIAKNNQSEFEILMCKIREDFAQNPTITQFLNIYDDRKGCFTDIDYSRRDRTKWPPLVHIDRLYDFAFAYTNPQNAYYQDENIYNKIVKGLEYWYEYNPHCNNWWYNQIAEPQKVGILLIQMRTGKMKIPSELENKTLQRIHKEGGHPAKWTGANRTDIALHWIYRACLEKNETDLETALENAYSPIEYTLKEGFQHDNSYFQHGQQLYIGGYGDEILKGTTQVAMYTRGTKYALSPEKTELLSKFMRHTYYQTIRGQYMLFDVLGRGVSRENTTDKSASALFARRMAIIDPNHADEYNAIITRLEGKQAADYKLGPLHTHYFRGDYTLHVRPAYTFDVRMVSNRTIRCEYGNEENLKTYFMSDGCTNIVIRGNEYANIFPVWNWTRIPGITAPQVNVVPMAASDWQTRGTSTFAGGVSDSIYGASAYAYMDTYNGINTGARKAWFFFDDEIVCLGAGVNSSSPMPVYTTINQCLLSSKPVIVSQNKKQTPIQKGKFSYSSPDWVLHDSIGYLFPFGGQIVLSNQQQTGSWYDINRTESKDLQHKEIFTLSIDHGINPYNNTYAYIIVPAIETEEKLISYVKEKNIEILTNTDSMQIVKHKKLNIWQMIFYQAGEFKNKELTVKVDQGCALMIKRSKKQELSFHIADPGQTQSNIKVGIHMRHFRKMKFFNCDFRDTGIYAGATQAYNIDL